MEGNDEVNKTGKWNYIILFFSFFVKKKEEISLCHAVHTFSSQMSVCIMYITMVIHVYKFPLNVGYTWKTFNLLYILVTSLPCRSLSFFYFNIFPHRNHKDDNFSASLPNRMVVGVVSHNHSMPGYTHNYPILLLCNDNSKTNIMRKMFFLLQCILLFNGSAQNIVIFLYGIHWHFSLYFNHSRTTRVNCREKKLFYSGMTTEDHKVYFLGLTFLWCFGKNSIFIFFNSIIIKTLFRAFFYPLWL